MTDAEAALDQILDTLIAPDPPPSVVAVTLAATPEIQPRVVVAFADGSALALTVEPAFVTSSSG